MTAPASDSPLESPGEKRALVDAVRFFHGRGWCPATSSNFSYRAPAGGCWISQSGVDKGGFGPEHLLRVDLDGRPVPPESRRPSAETSLHTLAYRLRSEVGAVLHVHAPLSVVASRARLEEGAVRFRGWELQKGLRGVDTHEAEVEIPIFANRQDMSALAAEVRPVLEARPDLQAFLLAGHGLYALGRDVAEAKRHIEVIETLLAHERDLRTMS